MMGAVYDADGRPVQERRDNLTIFFIIFAILTVIFRSTAAGIKESLPLLVALFLCLALWLHDRCRGLV
jgi:predicted RND superfamily exporter protein